MQFRSSGAALAALIMFGAVGTGSAAAQSCEGTPREADANGQVAGTLGGGIVGGLVLAMLQLKHHREAPSLKPGMIPMSESAVPMPPPAPTVAVAAGTLGGAPSADPAPPPGMARDVADATPKPNVAAAPLFSEHDAKREGLVPPKTGTMLPALAMIGMGALLLGLLFVRGRSRHRHY